MGTSASSKGPGSGVPLVPPWVEDNPEVAEPSRFKAARINLGKFAKNGSEDSLGRGLGYYSKNGLGGSANGASRMGRSTRAAGGYADVLRALSDGTQIPADVPLDPAALAGKGQQDVADAIIDAVTPSDGTQDADISRDSAARAFAEVLQQDPNADLTALSAEQIELFFELFLANDLVSRIQLDVGMAVFDKASNSAEAVQRLEQMQQYVRQEFLRSIRELKAAGTRLQQGNGKALGDSAIKATLEIFEEWVN